MPENLNCYSNYAERINCKYHVSGPGSGSFFLTLADISEQEIEQPDMMCNLVSSTYDDSLNCNITNLNFSDVDYYRITVNDLSTAEILATIDEFEPCGNIKLDPPSNVSYYFNDTAYYIMWKGNNKFKGVTDIHCQLQIKKKASGQTNIKKIVIAEEALEKYVEILPSDFDEGSNYILIRCMTDPISQYRSHWSEWSSELKIDHHQKNAQGPIQRRDFIHIITVVTLLAFTLILLFLALRSTRINGIFMKNIPKPDGFFHPLYHIHNGDFQDWVKYPKKSRENKKEERGFSRNFDLYSTTVLYVQKEAISPVKLEPPLSEEDISLTHDTSNSMCWSDPLIEKEISLNGMYPTFYNHLPSFGNDIYDDSGTICSLDCPADYFSYEGNYIANSQEIVDSPLS
ncbi:interleukin-21 receptor-like [Eleutherodactylus coqui]|uniref:interleukin-21 receptor-like n=1 Tax=Eleutherodactylus coqui TaxID=57060 RepID=UPI003462714B